jgi:L-fuconolactonase
MKIDAHQHFWRYDATQYPWIQPGSPLHRDWLPADLAPLLAAQGLEGCIAVQARQTLDESRWLLELADHHSLIQGVVGWVDLRSPQVEHDLAALAPHPKFCGVRHVVQDELDPDFMLGADFQRGIGKLKNFNLTYDLLIYPSQLPAAIQLAHRFPEQPFVLDHLAKPPIKEGALEPWKTHIRELAKAPNVLCKVSGMVTEADHAAWQPADFQPYLEVIFEAFGEDRLMYGSDWPVCLLAASYPGAFALVDKYTRSLSPSAREKFFGGNAARFYRAR